MSLETLQCGPTTNGITLRINILETKEIMFYRPSRRKQQVVSAPFWHTEQVSEESPTFHSRVLLFPEVKSPQRELSFHGTFGPTEWKFQAGYVPQVWKFCLWTFCSQEWKCPGTKSPDTFQDVHCSVCSSYHSYLLEVIKLSITCSQLAVSSQHLYLLIMLMHVRLE